MPILETKDLILRHLRQFDVEGVYVQVYADSDVKNPCFGHKVHQKKRKKQLVFGLERRKDGDGVVGIFTDYESWRSQF